MTGKEEFEPLDEMFRKTFQDLPDTPATSGWDVPSPRVWQRVQVEMKPSTTGWAFQTWAMLAVLTVLLGAGLYYFYGKSQPAPLPAPTPVEQPVVTPPTPAPSQEITPTAPVEKPAVNPTAKTRPATAGTHSNQSVNSTTNPRGTDPGKVQAVPLPGSKPAVPNSTEREKSKEGKEN